MLTSATVDPFQGEDETERLRRRIERERRARQEAELLAERGTRELYERKRELELLHVIADAANGADSVEAAIQVALDEICVFAEWPVGHAYLATRDVPAELASLGLWHVNPEPRMAAFRQESEATRFRAGFGLPGRVFAARRGAWIVDVTQDENFPRCRAALAAGLRGAFAFPVLAGGRVMAVLEFFSAQPQEPDEVLLAIASKAGTQLGRVFERKLSDEAVRDGDARFHQVVENIHEALWMFDVESGRVVYVSPRYAEIWGCSDGRLREVPDSWMETIHDEDRPRVRQAQTARDGGSGQAETYRILRPDGAVRWIRHRTFAARDEFSKVRRLISVAEDITERKKLEEQFLRSQRMEAIGTLAGGVAHDLNNILAPVLMAAALLKERALSERDRDLLTMMEQSAQRGASIVQQLLTFSRGVEDTRGLIHPRHVLKEMAALMRETFPRDIAIEAAIAPDLRPVLGNATQLHQVLMNLCVNARDAMPRGGRLSLSAANVVVGAGDLHLHPEAKMGEYAVFTVADTGHGIPPQIVNRIFDPFFTTKTLGKGSGLGLSTVLGIVRSYGGFVTVATQVERGTAFKVYLPAAAETPVTTAAPPAPETLMGEGELILVVDDEPAVRTAVCALLEKYRYKVAAAANGREALATYARQRADVRLVLTDLMMPIMGGVALVEALHAGDPTLRIIATSGLDHEAKRAELLALGVTTVLAKPCEPRELLAAVRRELTSAR